MKLKTLFICCIVFIGGVKFFHTDIIPPKPLQVLNLQGFSCFMQKKGAIAVADLIGQLYDSPFAKLALTERLKPLLDYDLKHGTELVKTLEVYFNNCRNSANTARDLFIHRNTLLYRLEQISKILDLDLNNNEQVLIIQLALKALIMVK